MKVLVAGKNGQLAQSLHNTAPKGIHVVTMGSAELDISNKQAVEQHIASHKPDWVINAAAYTAVDQAETDAERANAVNHHGAAHLADACAQNGAKLLHISTDFVFDGAQGKPYQPSAPTAPLGIYGHSKRDGELAIEKSGATSCIVRTSWVFSPYGNNFVKTMLRLMRERDTLNVVDDQIGSPSSALDLAGFLWDLVAFDGELPQYLHWTNNGVCSWYDFAVAIERLGRQHQLLDSHTSIQPIPSSEYPTPAKRPHYSVLDKTQSWQYAAQATHWENALNNAIQQLAEK